MEENICAARGSLQTKDWACGRFPGQNGCLAESADHQRVAIRAVEAKDVNGRLPHCGIDFLANAEYRRAGGDS